MPQRQTIMLQSCGLHLLHEAQFGGSI